VIKKVFIDTDIILDVAMAQKPFFSTSRTILAMAETGRIIGVTSSNCIANLYYILRKVGGDTDARLFISGLTKCISVIAIDHHNVLEALKSKFSDFEDALQNSSAQENQCEYVLTRNTSDYKGSKLKVSLPEDFIKLYQ
jgi:predicted nucleic acid-binding protein